MNVIVISSAIVADNEWIKGLRGELPLSAIENNSVQLQAGERYRFITGIDGLPISSVIALRFAGYLELHFADDTFIVLQNYFTRCAEKKCLVEMALEKNAEGELLYFSLSADSFGLDLSDGNQLLLEQGDLVTLMSLAQGNIALSQIIYQAEDKHIALGDMFAEAESVSLEDNDSDNIGYSLLGLGALFAAGALVASSGSGSNSSDRLLVNDAQASSTPMNAEVSALQKIEDYTTGSSALTQATYTEAGISGVTENTLDTINALIAAAADGAADTVAEVHDIVNQGLALQKIEDYSTGSSALTQDTYTEAGIFGVTESTLDAINKRVSAAADGATDTVEEVQVLVDAGAFIFTWRLTADARQVALNVPANTPLNYKFDVDWNNDGDFNDDGEFGLTDSVSHTFDSLGDYDIRIRGDFPYMPSQSYPPNTTHPLIDIKQWGDNAWQNMSEMFAGVAIERFTASDIPDISKVIDMSSMFRRASEFNHDISGWDVSAVTNMKGMFDQTNFNRDIGNWNVSSVESMQGMFANTTYFNQSISKWNVSAVNNMSNMFFYAEKFNQDIGGWDVSKVTSMQNMFFYAEKFNQDIGDWDVSAVTNMEGMFDRSVLSVVNYDSLLSGWSDINLSSGEISLSKNIKLGVYNLSYTDATAHNYLQTQWNWTFDHDGIQAGVTVGDANDNVLGNSGSNADQIIHGLGGSDTITGGKGDDLINGGTGNNTLTGGDGKDTFRYSHLDLSTAAVSDTITDFDLNEDVLDLSVLLDGFGIAGYGDSANDFISLGADSNGKLQLGIDRNGSADDILGAYQLKISLANIVFNEHTHTNEWLTDLQSSGNLVLI